MKHTLHFLHIHINLLFYIKFISAESSSKLSIKLQIAEFGQSGSCSSLLNFLKARNGSDFTDLDNFPAENYRIKYKEKGKNLGGKHWKTRGWLDCKRVPSKNTLPSDRSTYLREGHFLMNLCIPRTTRVICIRELW